MSRDSQTGTQKQKIKWKKKKLSKILAIFMFFFFFFVCAIFNKLYVKNCVFFPCNSNKFADSKRKQREGEGDVDSLRKNKNYTQWPLKDLCETLLCSISRLQHNNLLPSVIVAGSSPSRLLFKHNFHFLAIR